MQSGEDVRENALKTTNFSLPVLGLLNLEKRPAAAHCLPADMRVIGEQIVNPGSLLTNASFGRARFSADVRVMAADIAFGKDNGEDCCITSAELLRKTSRFLKRKRYAFTIKRRAVFVSDERRLAENGPELFRNRLVVFRREAGKVGVSGSDQAHCEKIGRKDAGTGRFGDMSRAQCLARVRWSLNEKNQGSVPERTKNSSGFPAG